jgi:ribosomal protein S18 acetylase RimI-like enzyme
MVHVIPSKQTLVSPSQSRPVNLRTDLAPLADLIELVFADTMDSGGRAALREMRALSRMGAGVGLFAQMSEMTHGISLGYVWEEDGKIVGNVSVYPANWPRQLGETYIIANVGVHPDYRGRGIARHLMMRSLQMIRENGNARAILQVDHDNHARYLYQSLGFQEERTFTTWRRTSYAKIPAPPLEPAFIRSRRRSEWQVEFKLAHEIRPHEQGGLGWLRPLHQQFFKRSWVQRANDMINLRGFEYLMIVNPHQTNEIYGSAWIETAFGTSTRLTLLMNPPYRGIYDDILLNHIVKRYGRGIVTCEHPADDVITSGVLERYRFYNQRTVIHMRLDNP